MIEFNMIEPNKALIYVSLAAAIIKLFLASYILIRNPKSRVNQLFSIIFIGQGVWDLGKFFLWITVNPSIAMVWAKVSYTGYILSVVAFPHFCWAYLKRRNIFSGSKIGLFIWYIPLFVMVGSLFASNMVISELISPENSTYGFGIQLWQYEYGDLYDYFFQYYQILPFIYGLLVFFHKYWVTKSKDLRSQLRYLIIGISFPILIGIPTGVVAPIFGIILPPHNNILTLVMSIFLFIGIVKYKFLSIRPMEEQKAKGAVIDKELIKDFKIIFPNHYMISHEKSIPISYNIMLDYLWKKNYGLVITAHDPDIIREKFNLKTTPIVWVTDVETEHFSVGPNDINQLYETVAQFTQKVPNSFILIEGVGYLIKHNNFNKVIDFIRGVKEVVKKHNCCLVMPRGGVRLEKNQEIILEQELETLPMPRVLKKTRELTQTVGSIDKRKRFIIFGHNSISASIVNEFEIRRLNFTLVTKSKIDVKLPKKLAKLVVGDPSNKKFLEELNMDYNNVIILVTADNDSDAILWINLIRGLTSKAKVLVNIDDQEFYQVAKEAGADEVISSLSVGGRLMSLAISSPNIVNWIMDTTTYVSKESELIEIEVGKKSRLKDKKVIDVDNKLGGRANILGIKTDEGLKRIADDDYVLKEGDKLIMIADLKGFKCKELNRESLRKWIEACYYR